MADIPLEAEEDGPSLHPRAEARPNGRVGGSVKELVIVPVGQFTHSIGMFRKTTKADEYRITQGVIDQLN